MKFVTVAHTDIGIKKSTNQDSVLMNIAETDLGQVCLAVLCDGMGGLAKGELASATLINEFEKWFQEQLPELLYKEKSLDAASLRSSWEQLVFTTSRRIGDYGEDINVRLGTTLAAFLIFQNNYYIMNIGDSRVYSLTDRILQLTKDQTFVQREMDLGHMTFEEARRHPKRNMLLQCVGASSYIEPEFCVGKAEENAVYMLCSDGFRHVISPVELYDNLNPQVLKNLAVMKKKAEELTELNKSRHEDDNITVALIRTIA